MVRQRGESHRWQYIWLNEDWATYAEWLWSDHRGTTTVQEAYNEWYDAEPPESPYWQFQIGDPGPFNLFADQVYDRGAGTLHALRLTVGEEESFKGARLWLERYNDSTGTSEGFQEVYEEVSGQDLDEFFDIWLFRQEKPP